MLNFPTKSCTHTIFEDYLNMLALCTLGFHYQEKKHVQNSKACWARIANFFKLLVPDVIGIRSLLYGRQANSSKTTIQEIKVKKEIECSKKTYHEVKVEEIKANKIVFHLVKIKEEITNLELDHTSDEAICSYIDKDYILKF